MQNYLNQLAQRVQQPELGVQPRPVSRFEAPQYSNFEASSDSSEPASGSTFEPFESIIAGEPGKTGLPSDQFISTRISADKPAQRIENRNRNESKTTVPETSSTEEPQNLYLGQSISESSIAIHANRKLAAHQSTLEDNLIAIDKQSIAQSGRNAQPTKEPIKPVSQIEKPDELKNFSFSTDKPSSERRQFTGPIERVDHAERTQIKPGNADINKPAEASSAALTGSLVRQRYSDKKESPAQIEAEQIRSFVPFVNNDENLEEKKAPTNSVHISTTGTAILADTESFETRPLPERRSDLMPRPDFSSTQRKEIFKSFAESTEHALERATEAPTPTIQVTIGRIEVRATVAATPARKTPAKSPAMSLDEYLKQRNRGQR